MDQMNPKDKEQIWKQYLICKKIPTFFLAGEPLFELLKNMTGWSATNK
jgi:hypothetical protein